MDEFDYSDVFDEVDADEEAAVDEYYEWLDTYASTPLTYYGGLYAENTSPAKLQELLDR